MKENFVYKTIDGNEIYIKLVRSKKNPWYPLAIIEKIVINNPCDRINCKFINGYEIFGVKNIDGQPLIQINFDAKIMKEYETIRVKLGIIRYYSVNHLIDSQDIHLSMSLDLHEKYPLILEDIKTSLINEFGESKLYFYDDFKLNCDWASSYVRIGKIGFEIKGFVNEFDANSQLLTLKTKTVDDLEIEYFVDYVNFKGIGPLNKDTIAVVALRAKYDCAKKVCNRFNRYISIFDHESLFEKCPNIDILYYNHNISDYYGILNINNLAGFPNCDDQYDHHNRSNNIRYYLNRLSMYIPDLFKPEGIKLSQDKTVLTSVDYLIKRIKIYYGGDYAYICPLPNSVESIGEGALAWPSYLERTYLGPGYLTGVYLYTNSKIYKMDNNPFGKYPRSWRHLEMFYLFNQFTKDLVYIGDYSIAPNMQAYDKLASTIILGNEVKYISPNQQTYYKIRIIGPKIIGNYTKEEIKNFFSKN